jgi:hypothetical protein
MELSPIREANNCAATQELAIFFFFQVAVIREGRRHSK